MRRRELLKALAAPALILPSRALAWSHGTAGVTPPPGGAPATPPGAAPGFPGFGITSNLIWDDFLSLSTVDSTNSLAAGFNWYLLNFTTFAGTTMGGLPAQVGSDYTVADSSLNIINNNAAPWSGAEFNSYGYVATPSPHFITSMPTFSGNKPFYIEGLCQLQFLSSGGAFWIEDQNAMMRSIQNAGDSNPGAEFDLLEIRAGSFHAQSEHTWTGPNLISASHLGIDIPLTYTGIWRTFGLLVVPMAYNGGTGIAQFYYDRTPNGDAFNWTSDTAGVESSTYIIMMFGINLLIDYIGVWTVP